MQNGPLKGTRVIELGQIAAGPFASSLLADLGADVVKVERPDGGDGMRSWPPLTPATDDPANVYSENFASVNRNKRSIALDLKDQGSVAQLLQARTTGQGTYIDCSMLGGLIGVAALQTSEYFGTGKTPQPLGSAHPRNAPYQAFRASDDFFIIAAGIDRLWQEVCDAVGQPDLANDERFASQGQRAANQAELAAILQPEFAKRSAEDWLQEMDRRGVPCSPINTYPEILNDPQVEHLRLVRELTLPNGAKTNTTAFPVRMSGYEFEVYREPPELGADTDAVIADWLG